jgi:hypothetical protein
VRRIYFSPHTNCILCKTLNKSHFSIVRTKINCSKGTIMGTESISQICLPSECHRTLHTLLSVFLNEMLETITINIKNNSVIT